ncbi:UvrD-helicase domain-containing protein [Streptomyces spectabilis]|uniref:UvrD-helicase domain-containing protein n=1 Tax=Streptomyces spectabilis TaxID=68270 RepID=UPI0033E2D368
MPLFRELLTSGQGLDAGSGMGVFAGTAPQDLGLRLIGVELEQTTAELSRLLLPQMTVLNESFAETDLPPGVLDFSIGNPPFANIPITDVAPHRNGHLIHNYFLIKLVDLLREGTYGIWITSTGTLDARHSRAREQIARHADLIGAYRLPARVFARSAGTDVVVDVLVVRRRRSGEQPRDLSWLQVQPYRVGSHTPDLNRYFHAHPDHVLGTLAMRTTPRGPELTVRGSPDIADLLHARLHALAADAVAAGLAHCPHPDGPRRPALQVQEARTKHATDFSGRLFLDESGRIWQHNNGLPPIKARCADGDTDQLRLLVRLRDSALELAALDAAATADRTAADQLRAQLRDTHHTYTQRWGPLSRPGRPLTRTQQPPGDRQETDRPLPTAWGWFVQDPQSACVLGLERWDAKTQAPVLASILHTRTETRAAVLQHTDDAQTALAAVHGQLGRVDLHEIARLLRTEPRQARAALGSTVFDDPEHPGELIPAWLYLSGPVRSKLDIARAAAHTDPAYQVNVTALTGALPPLRKIGEFKAKLGAAWIPEDLVQDYLRQRLGDPTLIAVHTHGGWSISAPAVLDAANALYGTPRRRAVEVAMRALNGGTTQLTCEEVLELSDGRTRTLQTVDEDATREYRQKIEIMRADFESWVLDDEGRLARITEAYNTQMNGHVLTRWEGLTPPTQGMTRARTLAPSQNAAAARMLHSDSTIVAHEMGLGKTTTALVGMMALKTAGRIHRPFVVAPKKALGVWQDEARLLFPHARILTIRHQDLTGSKRRPLLEYLRTDAHLYDLVIWQEEAFQSVPMSPEWQEWYEEEEIRLLTAQLTTEKSRLGAELRCKVLEERLERRRQEIRRAKAPARRPGEIYLDDLRPDFAAIDEAHRYKGLAIKSGLLHNAPEDSLRGLHLHQFTTWLHAVYPGRPRLALLTGTPLTNTIADMHNLLRIAAPEVLAAFQVLLFDDWGMTYGELVARIEQAPDGSGIKLVERFSRFTDLQSLMTKWLTIADVMLADDTGIQRPAIRGGRPHLVLADDTPEQRAYGKDLIARGTAIHNGDARRQWLKDLVAWEDAGRPGGRGAAPRPDIMLSVISDGRKIAMDPRLYRADAAPGNKISIVGELGAQIYHATKDNRYTYSTSDQRPHPRHGGLLLIFCDLGTPGGQRSSKATGFRTYDALKADFVARGVPAEKIAYVHDAGDSPQAFAELCAKAWDGRINILIGSSDTMGESINVQNRVTDVIHLDPTLTPHRMDQRNARGRRQGNQHADIGIHLVGTRHTLDSWEYGILTSKVASTRVVMSRSVHQALLLEIDEAEADFGTMQAELSGNPYLRQLFDTRALARDLASDQRISAAQRLNVRTLLAEKTAQAARIRAALPVRAAALPRIQATTGEDFCLILDGTTYDHYTPAALALHQILVHALRTHASAGEPPAAASGRFGGLPLRVETHIADAALTAQLNFPDLPGSLIQVTPATLQNDTTGKHLIGQLRRALEAAPQLQDAEAAQLPRLECEISELETARADDIDYDARITAALARITHLEAIVTAYAELDKLPADDGTPTPLHAERLKRQGVIDRARTRLEEHDRTAPCAPTPPRAPHQPASAAGKAAHPGQAPASTSGAGGQPPDSSTTPAPPGRNTMADPAASASEALPAPTAGPTSQRSSQAASRAATPPPPAADQPDDPDEPAEQQALLAETRDLYVLLESEEITEEQRDTAQARLSALVRQRRLFLGRPEPEDLTDPDERRRAQARRDSRQAHAEAQRHEKRAAQLQQQADAAHGRAHDAFARFQGGQPILEGHHSERSARRAQQRGDAAMDKALDLSTQVEREQGKAREARARAGIADRRAGMTRSFRQSDFQAGDIIEYTWRESTVNRSVVRRANPTTITQVDSSNRIEYWRILGRIRDRQLVEDPGQLDTPQPAPVAAPPATDAAMEPAQDVAAAPAGFSAAEPAAPEPAHHPTASGPGNDHSHDRPPAATASSLADDGHDSISDPADTHARLSSPQAVLQVQNTPVALRDDAELEDEDSALTDILRALDGATNPLDLAYRLRAERRAWEVTQEQQRREPLAPARDRGQVLRDRVWGYGLTDDAPPLASATLEQAYAALPPGKSTALSDQQWQRVQEQAAQEESFPPTPEQQLALDAIVRRRLNTAVRALAGTGKSALIQMVARRMPEQKIAVLAFGRKVVEEARAAKAAGKYGPHVEPMTANGMALRAVNPRYQQAGRPLEQRLSGSGGERQPGQQIADLMRVYEDLYVGAHRLIPSYAAGLARTLLTRWCQSTDAEAGPQHAKVPTFLGEDNRQVLFDVLKPLVDRMWADITDPYGVLTYDHDYIVKQWALSGGRVPYDVIAWDEAQDVNPVLDGVLRAALRQGVQVVAVGDAHQSIYSFRGATDALSHFPVDVQLTLTQSFRFGELIADAGNRCLRLLGTRMRLKGLPTKPSTVGELAPDDVDAILTRTNATAVTEALNALDSGKRVAVAGGLDEIREFLAGVEELRTQGTTRHKDLAAFSSWEQVKDYVDAESEAAGSMRTIVHLIDKDHEGRLHDLFAANGLADIRLSDDGQRLWIAGTQPGSLDHQDFIDWMKDKDANGIGKFEYDGSGRWYFQPGRHRSSFERNGSTISYWVNNRALPLADVHKASCLPTASRSRPA